MGENAKEPVTVHLADDLAAAVLSLVDALATGEASVHELIGSAITKADEYRTARMAEALGLLSERKGEHRMNDAREPGINVAEAFCDHGVWLGDANPNRPCPKCAEENG